VRPAIVVGIAALLVLGGCSANPGGSQSPSPTATPAVPPDTAPENTVGFENLRDGQQAAFLDAVGGGASFGPDSPNLDVYDDELLSPFRSNEYVRYEGTYYRIRVDSAGITYMSRDVAIRPEEPDSGDRIVDFEDLPRETREELEPAMGGIYESGYGERPPDVLFDAVVIRYGNETYGAEFGMVSDAPGYELTAVEYEPADGDATASSSPP
jgi:hypothetical protein